METKIQKNVHNAIAILTGALLVTTFSMNSAQAKEIDLSEFPLSYNQKQPTQLVMPNINNHQNKIIPSIFPKIQGKKPILKISNPRGKRIIREIDYFKNDEIVIPFFASLAYDGKGNNLKGSSLKWSYRKNGSIWVSFGTGNNVNLKLRPDSARTHNNIYKVDIRLVGKDPKNGLTSVTTTKITILAIAK